VPSFCKNGLQVGLCPRCGVIAVMDQVDPSDLEKLYGNDYYAKDCARYVKVTHGHRATWLRRLRLIEKYQKSSGSGKRILDVGCSTGAFLAVAQGAGWDVWGVDISPEATREARERVGSGRISEDLFALGAAGSFDVVSMWAVLEHLADPVSYLRQARLLLRPGGILALATVNTDAWNRKLFKSKWRYFTPPEHLVYFNTRNLAQTLCDLGFKELYVATRFSDRAFWQGAGVCDFQRAHWIVRKLRRLLLLPLGSAASWLKQGDIIELIARQV